MTTTAALEHRSTRVDFDDPHATAPSSWEHGWDVLLLFFIMVGDLTAFSIILQEAVPTSTALLTLLVVAFTAAAVLLMHKAGELQRAFKSGTAAHGRWLHRSLIGLWLALGLGAFTFRLATEYTTLTTTSGFARQSAVVSSSGSQLLLGPEVLPLSLLLLLLFLAGGVGAFAIGYVNHNPRRSALLRLHRWTDRAERRLRRAERWRDRRSRQTLELTHEVTVREAEQHARLTIVAGEAQRLREAGTFAMSAGAQDLASFPGAADALAALEAAHATHAAVLAERPLPIADLQHDLDHLNADAAATKHLLGLRMAADVAEGAPPTSSISEAEAALAEALAERDARAAALAADAPAGVEKQVSTLVADADALKQIIRVRFAAAAGEPPATNALLPNPSKDPEDAR